MQIITASCREGTHITKVQSNTVCKPQKEDEALLKDTVDEIKLKSDRW
jgi:hypothetical protein